jgi:DNA-binding transcriptional MerR regulator
MSNEQRYTIGELSQKAGVTPRTVRFYTSEGLLPSPDSRGRYALYSDEHLTRLQLIMRLKAAYLPLNLIREQIAHLSGNEARRLLAELPSDDEAVIAALPGRLLPSLGFHTPALSAEASLEGAGAHMARGPLQVGRVDLPDTRVEADVGGLLRRVAEHSATYAAQRPPAEVWQRLSLAPGIEIQLREPLSAQRRRQVEQLLDAARAILAEGEG